MKVTNADNFHKNELKRLENSRKHLLMSKEAELKSIKQGLDSQIEDVKVTNDQKLQELKAKQDTEKLSSLQKHQDQLEGHKNDLQQTVKILDTQKKQLILANEMQKGSINDSFQTNMNQKMIEQEDALSQIDQDAKLKAHKIEAQANQFVRESTYGAQDKMLEITQQNEAKFRKAAVDHQKAINQKELENYANIVGKKIDHEQNLSKFKMKSMIEAQQVKEIHTSTMDREKKMFIQHMQDQREAFKGKLNALTASHEKTYAKVAEQFTKELDQMTQSHASKKRTIASKQLDTFYHVTTVKPTVTDMPKQYLVSLNIPEHEKEGVKINVNDRDIRIHLSRNFKDEFVDDKGGVNKSQRTEIVTKTLTVKDLMDQSKATSSYKDGVLTFTIPKK